MESENINIAFKRHRRNPEEILFINSSPQTEAQRAHDILKSELDKPDLAIDSDYSNLSAEFKGSCKNDGILLMNEGQGEEAAYQLGHFGKTSQNSRIEQNEEKIKKLEQKGKLVASKIS